MSSAKDPVAAKHHSASVALPQFLFPLLLTFVHWVAAALWAIRAAVKKFARTLSSERESCPSESSSSLSLLTKLPSHIAFAVSERCVSFFDLANLVAWSLAAGIPNVSLYDHDGKIKAGRTELMAAFRAQESLDAETRRSVSWRCGGGGTSGDHGDYSSMTTNGNGTGRTRGLRNVSLLSVEDGRGDIVRAARKLAGRVSRGELAAEEIDQVAVERHLEANEGMPDPDVLVRIGPAESNMGFLPWQIRLTEIHQMESLEDVRWSDLFTVLIKFSRCEQRFGK